VTAEPKKSMLPPISSKEKLDLNDLDDLLDDFQPKSKQKLPPLKKSEQWGKSQEKTNGQQNTDEQFFEGGEDDPWEELTRNDGKANQ